MQMMNAEQGGRVSGCGFVLRNSAMDPNVMFMFQAYSLLVSESAKL